MRSHATDPGYRAPSVTPRAPWGISWPRCSLWHGRWWLHLRECGFLRLDARHDARVLALDLRLLLPPVDRCRALTGASCRRGAVGRGTLPADARELVDKVSIVALDFELLRRGKRATPIASWPCAASRLSRAALGGHI
eukprot:CAMPEP_0185558250 /NCGR_PEP_ID=MMETSP1381-20130426/51805_1 /TAXON_ID=298111 /ORGANISM="Pavlova sp., Strain CCMP459" /LENGTH=137 /DNA_ID=CAMNT_0028171787 /DNA_START=210 /DNA_END=620 /DNA_ORIENTATION=+